MDIVLKQLSQTSDILTQGFSTAGLRLSKWVVADFVQVVIKLRQIGEVTFLIQSLKLCKIDHIKGFYCMYNKKK